MRRPTTDCSDERPQLLLHSEDDSIETRSAPQHVDQCRACQVRLEQLAAAPMEWHLVRSSLLAAEDERAAAGSAANEQRP